MRFWRKHYLHRVSCLVLLDKIRISGRVKITGWKFDKHVLLHKIRSVNELKFVVTVSLALLIRNSSSENLWGTPSGSRCRDSGPLSSRNTRVQSWWMRQLRPSRSVNRYLHAKRFRNVITVCRRSWPLVWVMRIGCMDPRDRKEQKTGGKCSFLHFSEY